MPWHLGALRIGIAGITKGGVAGMGLWYICLDSS